MRRFREFENADDWEECGLGDVAEIFDGTHQTPKYTDSGVKFVSVENISTLETTKLISEEAYLKEYSNKQAEKGDVLMTRIGDIGTTKVIETDETLAYYVTLALLKPKGLDSNFLAQLISSPEVQRNIWKRTLHIAFPKKINLGEINQIELVLPSEEEQTKIGTFFSTIDTTITFHQRKLEKVKALKTAYLAEMFPAEGERKPKRRFAGFTDAWEQCRLGDVTSKIGSGKTPKGGESTYANQGIPLIRSQNIYDAIVDLRGVAFISAETDSEMQNSRVNPDDILLNITGASIGRSAVYMEDFPANVNQHVCIVRPTSEYSPTFIQQNIASSTGQNQIDSFQAGGAREGLNFQQIAKISFSFPSFEEQTKIGTFFSTLDHTITFHQRKLEKLQNIKNAYLNEMFV